MGKQAYLIVTFTNEIQSISVASVKRLIRLVYIAPIIFVSFLFLGPRLYQLSP